MDENCIANDREPIKSHDKMENLEERVTSLQSAIKSMADEFGIQRAKMKDYIMQKEDELKHQLSEQDLLKKTIKDLQTELDETKSHLMVMTLESQSKLDQEKRKYQEELSTLQHLLNESVEETSRYERENKRLSSVNNRLIAEMNEQRPSSSGADILSVPGTVISTLARRVTSQLSTQLTGSTDSVNSAGAQPSPDAMDDSMRKAKEDAEVLRSLVVPLEEEIKALKDKLRETDAELRKCQNIEDMIDFNENTCSNKGKQNDCDSNDEYASQRNKVPDKATEDNNIDSLLSGSPLTQPNGKKSTIPCEACGNYEAQLVNAQQKIHDLEYYIVSLEKYKQELCKETTFRKEMEAKWNEKKEEYKEQVAKLLEETNKAKDTIKELRATFSNTYEEVTQELIKLRSETDMVKSEFEKVQRSYDMLVGKHTKNSQQLHNEVIDLPNNVDELQELILGCKEELITAKSAKELAEDMVHELKLEIEMLKNNSQSEEETRSKLQYDVDMICQERNFHIEAYHELQKSNEALKKEIDELRSRLVKVTNSKKHLEETVGGLRGQITSLQNELDNSEKVQKDFVLLSQSLQQELEKIRQAGTEVRWEHEEDVHECKRCKSSFSAVKKKVHCKHCGRIYCSTCLTHTVNSGPNNRPSRVCDVCHTLLVQDSAPYFSEVPPQPSS